MPHQVLVDRPALAPRLRVGRPSPGTSCSKDAGRDQQVEPGGAEELALKAAVADLAEPAEIDGMGQRVARFALVEPEMGAAAEVGFLIQSSVNSVRSMRPISRSALASPFWRG